MDDSSILNWLQDNGLAIHQGINETFILTWLDVGIARNTLGYSLRDCVRRAIDRQYISEESA